MRIDYSVPKTSRSSSQTSQKLTRNVSFGWVVIVVIITALISLGVGFGSGLMFSRRSAQTPREQTATPPPHSITAQKQAADASVPPNPTTATGGQQAGDAPLRFYTMLPRGQTNTTLGSGINSKDDKPATQSLPAAPAMSADAVGFTVLVASYSLKSAAETLHATLTAKGHYARIVESRLADKGIWYHVRVGKGLDLDAAKKLAIKLGKDATAIPDKD